MLGTPRANETTGAVAGGGFTCALGPSATNGSRSAYFSNVDALESKGFTANWSGQHRVVYKWRITWNATGSLALASPHTGNDSVMIYVFGNLCYWDVAQGGCVWAYSAPGHSAVEEGTPVWVFNESGSFSSGQRDQIVTVSFLYDFTKGDLYLFDTGLNLTEYSVADTVCTSSGCLQNYAQATSNVDRSGDHAKVLSMSVL
jgi:hypothetical protein